jgi:hypothetical protein
MRRVLIVAYYFPPIGGIGSIRMARFAEHLPEFGWDPVVLAPRDTPHALDKQLRYSAGQVVRSRSIELSRLGNALPRRSGPVGASRSTISRDELRSRALRWVFPDAQIGWYPGAVLTGLGLLRQRHFDAVYSSSYPMTAHLVARTLTRRSQRPWVAEFRDPWSPSLPVHSPYRRWAAHFERTLAGHASALVMPTPTWASHFGQMWGRDISVIPNGFDAPTQSASPPDRPTLTYLGTYYPGRQNLAPLWDAVARRLNRPSGPPPRVRFIGELPTAGRVELRAAGLEGLIEETGVISHHHATQLLTRSSMLIASGDVRTDEVARGWVPAKLFEYLATPMPILYLGSPADDAALMLARYPGCLVVERDDREALDAALAEGLAGSRYDRDVSDLSRHARARMLAVALDNAASAGRRA